MTQVGKAKLRAWKDELASSFAARRCACGAPAVAVRPGRAEQRSSATDILLVAAIPDVAFCLEHAIAARKAA